MLTSCLIVAALAGCGTSPFAPRDAALTEADLPATGTRPVARPEGARAPPAGARSAGAFDTTSDAERAAALAAATAAPAPAATALTTVSLGDPASPGLWLETPLVTAVTKATVRVPATGKAAELDLRPIPGARTAGSRMSLAAMRLLDLPLTALTEVEVALP